MGVETDAPVLVIHGVGTRDRKEFERDVATLAKSVATGHRFIPVYWGDLGARSAGLDTAVPYSSWLSDSRDRFTRLIDKPTERPDLTQFRKAMEAKDLDAALRVFGQGWRHFSKMSRRTVIGAVFGMFREQYVAASAEFIGDLLVYERRRAEIQAHIWQTIMRDAPGYGLPERPVNAVAHSLGGVILFDMAIAGQPRLHLDRFMTCGSQPSFFHVIGGTPPPLSPYREGETTALPSSILRWTNFFVPLDLWAFVVAPVFRLKDGGIPEDIEVHAERRADRWFKHAANYYWRHPVVHERIRATLRGSMQQN